MSEMKFNPEKHVHGKLCIKCGSSIRYRNGGKCVRCKLEYKRKYKKDNSDKKRDEWKRYKEKYGKALNKKRRAKRKEERKRYLESDEYKNGEKKKKARIYREALAKRKADEMRIKHHYEQLEYWRSDEWKEKKRQRIVERARERRRTHGDVIDHRRITVEDIDYLCGLSGKRMTEICEEMGVPRGKLSKVKDRIKRTGVAWGGEFSLLFWAYQAKFIKENTPSTPWAT